MAMLVLGNALAKTGWAPWFPWSIVPLLIGMVGQPAQALPPGGFVVLGLTLSRASRLPSGGSPTSTATSERAQ
jgi:ABC-2 type transport system permease protein